jgi:hypothetical protein
MRPPILFLLVVLSAAFGCGDGDSDSEASREECRRACGDINFAGQCIQADTLADCQEACLVESPSTVESFSDCVRSNLGAVDQTTGEPTCAEGDCVSILNVEPSSGTN